MDLPRNATHAQIVEHVREAICTAYGWMPDDWEALRIAQNVADNADRFVDGVDREPSSLINLMFATQSGAAAHGVQFASDWFLDRVGVQHDLMTRREVAVALVELAAFMRSRGGDLREIESSSLPDPTPGAPDVIVLDEFWDLTKQASDVSRLEGLLGSLFRPEPSAPAEPESAPRGLLDRAGIMDIMRSSVRGNDVREWPTDEIEFYRNGSWDDFTDRDTQLTDIALGRAADEILARMLNPRDLLRQWLGIDELSYPTSDILLDEELIMTLHEDRVETRRRVLDDAADVAPSPEVAQWLRDFAAKLH